MEEQKELTIWSRSKGIVKRVSARDARLSEAINSALDYASIHPETAAVWIVEGDSVRPILWSKRFV